jgi:hypothetical protein
VLGTDQRVVFDGGFFWRRRKPPSVRDQLPDSLVRGKAPTQRQGPQSAPEGQRQTGVESVSRGVGQNGTSSTGDSAKRSFGPRVPGLRRSW